MFLSLGLIFVLGILGGIIFEKIRLPKLIWYLILGILLGPSCANLVDNSVLNISSYLRQIALVLILTRSGLTLDISALKKAGRPAILMCFIPACFEMIGVIIFSPLFLSISYLEACLLGSVLAAVSPAIVVPRMIKLKDEGYGHLIPEVVLAGASCDDIFVIVLFYSFKGIVSSGIVNFHMGYQIPLSIFLGILLGTLVGILLRAAFKYFQMSIALKIILLLGVSFLMLALEEVVKDKVLISSLLGIIVTAIILQYKNKDASNKIEKGYRSLWNGFEILLFVLVGCAVDIKYAISKDSAILLGVLFMGLIFRSLGVILCILRTPFNRKEKLFIILSYLPKATVQASIGGIALSEGLACGTLVLTAAVLSILITAPLGAILIDTSYPKLLKKDEFYSNAT